MQKRKFSARSPPQADYVSLYFVRLKQQTFNLKMKGNES